MDPMLAVIQYPILHRSGERRFGGRDSFRRSDVHPKAVEAKAE